MLAMMGMTAAGGPSMKAQISKVTDMVKVSTTQGELASISQIIYLEWVADEKLPPAESIQEMIRTNMTAAGNRDVSKDTWGTSYAYAAVNENGQDIAFILLSAGPDKQYGTDDDIQLKRKLGGGGGPETPLPGDEGRLPFNEQLHARYALNFDAPDTSCRLLARKEAPPASGRYKGSTFSLRKTAQEQTEKKLPEA